MNSLSRVAKIIVASFSLLSLGGCGGGSSGSGGTGGTGPTSSGGTGTPTSIAPTCTVGDEGCACYLNKTCNTAALVCLSNLCVSPGTNGGAPGAGGTTSFPGTGGTVATSGTPGNGGAPATGGVVSPTGGTPGTGGVPSGASVLASGQGQPCQILAIAGTLYWTDYSSGALMALGPAGGEPTRLLSLKSACSIAADSTNLYVTGMDSTDRNSVMQVPLAGGTTKELYHSQTTSVTLHGGALACDGTYVYWAQGPYIRKIAIADGTAKNLVTSGVPCVLAIDDTNVYYTDDIAVAVMVVPKSGGAAVTLFQGQIGAYGIAVNSGYVIFANYDQKSVMRVPLAGGTAETLATDVRTVTSFAIDAANIYWTDQLANIVGKVPLAGGVSTTIAEHQSQPLSVAVDSTNVYWANQGSIGKATGSIAMTSK